MGADAPRVRLVGTRQARREPTRQAAVPPRVATAFNRPAYLADERSPGLRYGVKRPTWLGVVLFWLFVAVTIGEAVLAGLALPGDLVFGVSEAVLSAVFCTYAVLYGRRLWSAHRRRRSSHNVPER